MSAISSETYISVDVETGGPVPGIHPLLSLGACVVGDAEQTFYAELKPRPNTVSVQAALDATGLDPEQFAICGQEPVGAACRFAQWVAEVSAESRPVFVAFNAPFDWAFVVRFFHEANVENPFGFSALDIKAFYMGLHGTTWDQTRSSQLPNAYALRPDREHHALSDAVAQAASFARMLARARSS